MKTPEQMASKWYWDNLTEESPVVMLTNPEKHPPCPRKAFVAGYKAGQDDMQTQLAVGEDVVRHLLNAPQWISVKDKLPDENVWVLGYYCRNKNEKFVVGSVQRFVHSWAEASIWMTDIVSDALSYEEVYSITHWMPLPEAPKEEK